MRYFYALALLVVFVAAVQAQYIPPQAPCPPQAPAVVPKQVPKPTPTWIKWNNGWLQSSVKPHNWDHPFWGCKDYDFDWSTWFPSAEDVAECEAYMKALGQTHEPQNQHFISHMQQSPWQIKQREKVKYSVTQQTYAMPAQSFYGYTPTTWSGMAAPSYGVYGSGYSMKSRGKLFGRGGGGCGPGG